MRFVPANCPALVKLENEIKIASQGGIPLLTAISPKAKETGIYPIIIGAPRRKP